MKSNVRIGFNNYFAGCRWHVVHRQENNEARKIGQIIYILGRSQSVEGARLEEALHLLTGRTILDLEENIEHPCSLSAGCICVYINSFRDVSDREFGSRVHLVHSKIEHNDNIGALGYHGYPSHE